MYSVADYGRMIADEPRTQAYAEALRRAVCPGSVVVDIGTGTGILTLLACHFGARRVFAIEADPVIQVAREVVAANGFASRVEFFPVVSTQAVLPERADVIVSDLHGVLPLHERMIPALVDARTRFLALGGRLIPSREMLWATVVEAPQLHARYVGLASPRGFAFNLEVARQRMANSWYKARVSPEQFIVPPHCWATLDYHALDSPDVAAEISWPVPRSATAHGVLLWFDAELIEGVRFSNSPALPELIYGSGFFPLREPLPLAAGEILRLALRADLVESEYHWRWEVRVHPTPESAQPRAALSQGTFFGMPFSPAHLAKHDASFVPALNEDGEAELFALERFRAGDSLGRIAAELTRRFPRRFASDHAALSWLGDLSQRFSR